LGGVVASSFPAVYTPTGCADEHEPRWNEDKPSNVLRGMISRQKNPDNTEFPFSTLSSFVTPSEQFFIRSHFSIPDVNLQQWKLSIEGHVERPFEIGLDELRELPARTSHALLECSGNSRVFLEPPQIGIRWEQGAVGNAEWTGVPLASLLDRAGVKPGAVEVILEGHDKGQLEPPEPPTPGEVHYARSLPLESARRPEVLLAYAMNGTDLSPAHGFPVRALVAGWYGMASVKWLRRIIVTDRPFSGYFQTFAYSVWERRDGLPTLVPVTEIQVKSQIARPTLHEVIPSAATYRVFGAAWAGAHEVVKVEFSADRGQTWSPGNLHETSAPFTWRLFDYWWQTPAVPGTHVLMTRATDARGRPQPIERDSDRRDAIINHVQPIEVYVR
jgi:DMSO/TMAO reductase YedYZ molybdopterin-dependent catalytic subunit